jgi:hypothetical protein
MPAAVRRSLAAIGAVAVVAGARGVLLGASEVQRPGTVTPDVDSEYRFYAAWYPIVGMALLQASRGRSLDGSVLSGASAGLFLAAAGRTLSLKRYGQPHWTQLTLLGAELVAPTALLWWSRRAPRRVVDDRVAGEWRGATSRAAAMIGPCPTASSSGTSTAR